MDKSPAVKLAYGLVLADIERKFLLSKPEAREWPWRPAPDGYYVYVWLDSDGEVEYVGKGSGNRAYGGKPWLTRHHRLVLFTAGDEEWEALASEAILIGLLRPRRNREGLKKAGRSEPTVDPLSVLRRRTA